MLQCPLWEWGRAQGKAELDGLKGQTWLRGSGKSLLFRKELANDSPQVPSALKLELEAEASCFISALRMTSRGCPQGKDTAGGEEGGALGQALLQFAKAPSLGFGNL